MNILGHLRGIGRVQVRMNTKYPVVRYETSHLVLGQVLHP